MKIVFDPAKNLINIAKHGIPLSDASEFVMDAAFVRDTVRFGERRKAAIGPIGLSLYVLAYVERDGEIRAISLRPANQSKRRLYEQAMES